MSNERALNVTCLILGVAGVGLGGYDPNWLPAMGGYASTILVVVCGVLFGRALARLLHN
jgi:hypothetical protein